jgi:hypothetical protein
MSSDDYSPIRVGIYLGLVILSTIIITPLEVISTRLAIQRNHASPEFNSVAQEEEGDQDEHVEYSAADEDVIGYVFTYFRNRLERDNVFRGWLLRGTPLFFSQ